jgi:hypothetical protein
MPANDAETRRKLLRDAVKLVAEMRRNVPHRACLVEDCWACRADALIDAVQEGESAPTFARTAP